MSEASEYQRMLAVLKVKQLLVNSPSFEGSEDDAEGVAEDLVGKAQLEVKLQRGTVGLTFELMPDPAQETPEESTVPEGAATAPDDGPHL